MFRPKSEHIDKKDELFIQLELMFAKNKKLQLKIEQLIEENQCIAPLQEKNQKLIDKVIALIEENRHLEKQLQTKADILTTPVFIMASLCKIIIIINYSGQNKNFKMLLEECKPNFQIVLH